MATSDQGVLTRVYRSRVRDPRTDDEVTGYWLIVAGLLLGLLGLFVVFGSQIDSFRRGLGIAISGVALMVFLLGTVLRLELRRRANYVAYAGAVVGLLAVLWFWLAYPTDWQFGSAQVWNVLGLGAVGIALMVVASVIVPLVPDQEAADRDAAEAAAADAAARARTADNRAAVAQKRAESAERSAAVEADERAEAESALADAEAALAAFDASQAQFELFADVAGEYRWRLRHRNGNVIADSGEGYASRQKAQQGIQSVKHNAAGGPVLDVEPIAPAVDEADDATGGEAAQPLLADAESQATFELYEDADERHRWRLRHDNGEIIADSGQGYASHTGVADAVTRARGTVPSAAYLSVDPVAFELYQDRADEWRWRLIHENGSILADGGEGYSGRTRCRQGAESVATNVGPDGDAEFEVYQNNRGEYSWRLRHANGNIIADSGEGYATKSGADDAVERVRSYAPEADLLDVGDAAFELYEDSAEEWRWRLRHRNGNVLADSDEGYRDRSDAVAAVTRVKRHAPDADEETIAA
jgi:uncharacterized protein YegP (UPF0339 family)